MLEEDLVKLANTIRKRKAEWQTTEVKTAAKGCPKRLYDTLSSFSNQDSGGVIVFGLDENTDFTPTGVYDVSDLEKKVTEQCNQMEPPVRGVFTVAEFEGYNICAIEIPGLEIHLRPCYYKGAGIHSGSFIRVGEADRKMTDYEIYSYEAFKKQLHEDERPVGRADMDMLDNIKLQKYVLDQQTNRPNLARLSNDVIYEMLNIEREGKPTLAAIMNFALFPQGYFPQLCIIATVIPGTEIGDTDEAGARFEDNRRIEGTIDVMAEDAVDFCKRNMKTKTIIDSETGKRKDQPEYPVTAIREAVLNALIHRDYSIHTEGTAVQINMFSDRLEIHSPGNLYGRLTVEQLGKCKPNLRNPVLATMTEYLTKAENRYSGIPTMRRVMSEYGLHEPVFENRQDEFVVTLYNSKKEEDHNDLKEEITEKNEKNLLEFCKTPRTRKEIADFTGVKTVFYAMEKYVQPLVEKGLLKLELPDKPKSKNQRYFTVSN